MNNLMLSQKRTREDFLTNRLTDGPNDRPSHIIRRNQSISRRQSFGIFDNLPLHARC